MKSKPLKAAAFDGSPVDDSSDKQYTVVISERAAEMLVSHVRFLAQVSEAAASRLIASFTKSADSLETRPEANPWLATPPSLFHIVPEYKYRKLLFEKRYLMIYQVKGAKIHVDAVVDCRQDYWRFLI
jgi:plasmid stabilization system protein ParE